MDSRRRTIHRVAVFDEAFVGEMNRRYGWLDLEQRPLVARVAAHEDWQADRECIEQAVSQLHPDDQVPITHRLRKQFISALGELVVSDDLRRVGCSIRYDHEYRIEGRKLTPDWTATFDGIQFVCDAFTAGLSEGRDAFEDQAAALRSRLSRIEAPYTVQLEVTPDVDLSDGDRKRIVDEFAHDVRGMAIGAGWKRSGCTIEILAPSAKGIEVISVDPVHIVPTPESIRQNIREKAKKYACLGLPILIVAVRHPRAEMNTIMFEDAVRGRLVHVSGNLTDGRFVDGNMRQRGGALQNRPELSATMWRDPYTRHVHKAVAVLENDKANRPLPKSLLEGLRTAQPWF